MFLNIEKKYWIILLVIFILFFRFFNLTANDLSTDDALYSFRALGWFDFLGGGQTTPVQWFASLPAWANLSFHDAPPLVFAIQKIFFSIFGPTTLAARLPFAIAGVGVMALLYFLFKKFKNENWALLVVFILGLASYATWSHRIGYLEGVEVFFITLSIFCFSWYIKSGNKKNLWYFAVAMGLAVLCKYTAIFLIPAAILYLLIWQRSVFKKSEFWLAVVAFLVVISPIIIYNAQVYVTRGHFDAALSSMVGMHPEDFKIISGRSLSFDLINSVSTFWDTLFNTSSLPVVILIIVSLLYLFFKMIKKRSDNLEKIFGLNILMLLTLFLFMGFGPRFFSISLPFLAFSLAVLSNDLYHYLKTKKVLYLKMFLIVVVLIAGWEIFYNFNTNILANPIGRSPWLYSNYRFYDNGFNQLDKYLTDNIFTTLPELSRPTDLTKIKADFSSKKIVFFDGSVSWFSYSWYFQKYQVYYRLPLASLSDFMQAGNNISGLKTAGFEGFYFISAVDDSVLDSVRKKEPIRKVMVDFASQLEANGVKPLSIVSSRGVTTFKVYYFEF